MSHPQKTTVTVTYTVNVEAAADWLTEYAHSRSVKRLSPEDIAVRYIRHQLLSSSDYDGVPVREAKRTRDGGRGDDGRWRGRGPRRTIGTKKDNPHGTLP